MLFSRNYTRCIAAFCLLLSTSALAEPAESVAAETQPDSAPKPPVYTETPKFYAFATNVVEDVPHVFEHASIKDHWQAYLGILGLSAILIHYDQNITNTSQDYAHRLHLLSDDDSGSRSKAIWSKDIGGVGLDLRVPNGLNSYFYFVGDGLTSLGIIGGLAAYGSIKSDARSLNAASQVMEAIALTGLFIITAKFTAGRESPAKATERGGAWHPVPGVKNYLRAVSKYDAFPSGHIATAMTTVTILHKNFPEKLWILPVGYAAMGLLMFGMLNNGVHWAGDYPVGIAIGYVAASTVFDQRKPVEPPKAADGTPVEAAGSMNILPYVTDHGVGLMLSINT